MRDVGRHLLTLGGNFGEINMPRPIGYRLRFENSENRRSWVEVFYINFSDDVNDVEVTARIKDDIDHRAAALVQTNKVVDYTWWDLNNPVFTRYAIVNVPGAVPGSGPSGQDVVNVAINLKLRTPTRRRNYLMRGLADADVVNGRFQPRALAQAFYNTWFDWLISPARGFALRKSGFGSNIPLLSCTATQLNTSVNLTDPIHEKQLLSVRTRVSDGGPRVNTRVRVLEEAAAGQAKIVVKWTRGFCSGGNARLVTYSLDNIANLTIDTAGRTRRTGGPFTRFRGRRR